MRVSHFMPCKADTIILDFITIRMSKLKFYKRYAQAVSTELDRVLPKPEISDNTCMKPKLFPKLLKKAKIFPK